jgi:hypothetical protein
MADHPTTVHQKDLLATRLLGGLNTTLRAVFRIRDFFVLSSVTFQFFSLLLFVGTFKSLFTDKKPYRSHKTLEIKVFYTIFA